MFIEKFKKSKKVTAAAVAAALTLGGIAAPAAIAVGNTAHVPDGLMPPGQTEVVKDQAGNPIDDKTYPSGVKLGEPLPGQEGQEHPEIETGSTPLSESPELDTNLFNEDGSPKPPHEEMTTEPLNAPQARGVQAKGLQAGESNIELSVSRGADGTPPFDSDDGPGHDSGADNGVVRVSDWTTYNYQIRAQGAIQDNKVAITAPAPEGMLWYKSKNEMPAYCDANGSNVSADRKTLTCVVNNMELDSIRTVPLAAQADYKTVKDKQVLNYDPATVTATAKNADGSQDYNVHGTGIVTPVTASAAPIIDPQVSNWAVAAGYVDNGENGWLVSANIPAQIKDFSTRGTMGSTALQSEFTIVADISGMTPNSRFTNLVPSNQESGGAGCSKWIDTSSVFSGISNLTCSVDPANPKKLNIKVNYDDPSGNVRKQIAGIEKASETGYIGNFTVNTFVPYSDVPVNTSKNVSLSISGNNSTSPDANGGTVNNIGDVLSNNQGNVTLLQRPAGSRSISYHGSVGGNALLPNMSLIGDGQAALAGGYNSLVSSPRWVTPTTSSTLNGGLCEIIDAWGQDTIRASLDGSGSGLYNLEYSTSPLIVDKNAPLNTRVTQMQNATCDDAKGWKPLASNIPTNTMRESRYIPAAADQPNITAIRLIPVSGTVDAGTALSMWNQHKIKPGLPDNQPIGVTYAYRDASSGTNWKHDTFGGQPYNMTDPVNAQFPTGDRVQTTSDQLTVTTTMNNNSQGQLTNTKPGDIVDVHTTPRVQYGQSDPGPVTMKQKIPKGFTYVEGSADKAPRSVHVQPDGSTVIEWEFPTLVKGSEPTVNFKIKTGDTTTGDFVSPAVVYSAADKSSSKYPGYPNFPASMNGINNPHVTSATIKSIADDGMAVVKKVDRTDVEKSDVVSYRIATGNLDSTRTQTGTDLIDPLPFNGDSQKDTGVPGRTPVSSSVTNKVNLAAWPTVTNDAELFYTNAPSAEVYKNTKTSASALPDYGKLPAGFSWCTQAQVEAQATGCPKNRDEITAVKVSKAVLQPLEGFEMNMKLATNNQNGGSVFANDASAKSDQFTVGVDSADVLTHIWSSSVGNYVWEDQNKNGIHDPGEVMVPNVPVHLTGKDKNGDDVDLHTTTDANGKYTFDNLVSGDYSVAFDKSAQGADATWTTKRVGTDNLVNSAVNPDGTTDTFHVNDPSPNKANGEDFTQNAGLVKPVQVGLTTQTSAKNVEKGQTIHDKLTITSTGGAWPLAADGKPLALPVKSTLYKLDRIPEQSADVPEDAVKVGEVTTDVTGPGEYNSPDITADTSGVSVWVAEWPETGAVQAGKTEFNEPDEMTIVKWEPIVTTTAKVKPYIG